MGLAKDSLSEVIGLKNDIVHKVFTCPDCKTEVTISRYQVQGDLPIMCARCNMRFQIKGEELRDLNKDRLRRLQGLHQGRRRPEGCALCPRTPISSS